MATSLRLDPISSEVDIGVSFGYSLTRFNIQCDVSVKRG
jgi:hypothetical protein